MIFTATNKVLNEWGRLGVERSQFELKITRTIRGRKVSRVASGDLVKGIFYNVLKKKRDFAVKFGVKGPASRYASFIHDGVNGTQISVGSTYSFKGKFVNIGAIRKWIERPAFRLRNPKTGAFIEKNEKNINRATYLISRSIAKKGIVGVPFIDAGSEWAFNKIQRKLENAWEQDSVQFLTEE